MLSFHLNSAFRWLRPKGKAADMDQPGQLHTPHICCACKSALPAHARSRRSLRIVLAMCFGMQDTGNGVARWLIRSRHTTRISSILLPSYGTGSFRAFAELLRRSYHLYAFDVSDGFITRLFPGGADSRATNRHFSALRSTTTSLASPLTQALNIRIHSKNKNNKNTCL